MKKKIMFAAMLAAVGALAWGNAAYASALEKQLNGQEEAEELQASIAGKILRFHILANSDSDEDQSVKEAVRDAVGQELAPLLQEAGSLAETERIAAEHMDAVVETADAVLMENGFSYGADAELVTAEFPVKTYGAFTFPAGEYRALEITLGAGAGHNWWCVLYPNMCFRGTVCGIDPESGEELREILSPEEYAGIFDAKNYEVRWKFLEYFR